MAPEPQTAETKTAELLVQETKTAELLVQVARAVQDAHERRAREADVSPILARLLEVLAERAPTMNELGELIGLDKSSTSGLVGRAQRRGLVRRVPSQVDRRSVRVRLTPAGRELLGRVQAPFAGDVSAMLEPLPAQLVQGLGEALRQVLAVRPQR